MVTCKYIDTIAIAGALYHCGISAFPYSKGQERYFVGAHSTVPIPSLPKEVISARLGRAALSS